MSTAEVRTHSALHVVKGAIAKVLGPCTTASTDLGGRGARIVVQTEREPTKEEEARIELEANKEVQENAEFLQFEMEREEAEGHWGRSIYDASPVSGDVSMLTIVRIPGWDVSCCSAQHVEGTREIGMIRVDGLAFRSGEHLLEVEFHLGEPE